jgi:DNA repair exonuclease SbcCD ATPase subunit
MRLLRLHVADFAAIASADITFGPGLNVLYGPNDLGKSTLADSIRMGLLLPHTSTHIEPFVPWTGGQHPRIEITFETEAQRIWKVVKIFGKSGSSTLHESRNGIEFDETVRGRQVDARLREILRWGIPEPGGAGAARGMPTSFLATALLSTQANVGAILDGSLDTDSAQSGRERIAAALQAVAQDPAFVSLLRRTQERRDHAYTDKGAKKTGRDSPFRKAVERLNVLRGEKEHWQRAVDESQNVEHHLRDLISTRTAYEGRVAAASDQLSTLVRLMKEGTAVAAAADQVFQALERVSRIEKIDTDIATGERVLSALGRELAEAEKALADARRRKMEADAALAEALAAARTDGVDPQLAATVARQSLELRRSSAARASAAAEQQIAAAAAAQQVVDAAAQAESDERACVDAVGRAAIAASVAAEAEQSLAARRRRLELLEIAMLVRSADERLAVAESVVARGSTLRSRIESTLRDCKQLEARRAELVVPPPATLSAIRRLAGDLANARAALDVGLVVTIAPRGPIAVQLRKDGESSEMTLDTETVVIEADARIDLDLANLVAVTVQGGRRDAMDRVQLLEGRWASEALPHLQAADAADVEALEMKAADMRDLEAAIVSRHSELRSLEEQVAALGDSEQVHGKASAEAQQSRVALGTEPLEPLLHEISSLGPHAETKLRDRKASATREMEQVRRQSADCQSAHGVAEERLRAARSARQAVVESRDLAVTKFPGGLAAARSQAQAAFDAAVQEQQAVAADLAALEATIAAESARVEKAVAAARAAAVDAEQAVDAAERAHQKAIGEQASQSGSIEQLRRLREQENLEAATAALRVATAHQATLPVPDRVVTESDVTSAATALDQARVELAAIDGEVHKAHGALEQVGGAVARDRLQDVTEAYEAAEHHERETESEFEAWKLLLETMKAADAAQASNLGQVLAPAVASRFETLTEQRYESVRLTAQLATEGVVVRGAVRPAERMSVGTREQLSTLYRLSLAEYLGTSVVLDDQLVQSDDKRMDWFRELLLEKSGLFQVVVFTCRPGDYLAPAEHVPPDGPDFKTTGDVHAVNLDRAIRGR